MRRLLWVLGAALALAVAALPPGSGEALLSDDLQIVDLRVDGGSGWHPTPRFRIRWDQAPGASSPRAVLYRVYDPHGAALGPTVRNSEEVHAIDPVDVPSPGAYTAEVWLEGASGASGAHQTVPLRFDDVAPGPAAPIEPEGWIAGSEIARLRIAHPSSLPISGIRGYAVSVDRGEGSNPCAGTGGCSPAETDLAGGIDDDEIALGTLPQGLNMVRVVAVSGAGVPSAKAQSASLFVDATLPRVTLAGAPTGWARGPLQLTARAEDDLSGMRPGGPAGPFTAIAVDGAPPSRAEGASASTLVAGQGIHRVVAYARDAAGNLGDGTGGTAAPLAATVRIDETPPRVSFAPTQDTGDPERIEATVTDALSGPSPGEGSIAVRAANSHESYQGLATSVSAGRLLARWDSDSYPPGNYEFLATGADIAGNVVNGARRASGARMVLSNPLKRRVAVESGFGGRRMIWHRCTHRRGRRRCQDPRIEEFDSRPAQVTVPCGRRLRFGGRLLTGGSPLAGAEVAIIEKFAAGAAPPTRTALVQTDGRGFFSYRLPPGPSREVVASFAGSRTLSRGSGRSLHLQVRSSVKLTASASAARVGGAPIVFGGRIAAPGARIPSAGRPVELQFRYPGATWSEFRTVQTDGSGRFRYAYSFSDDDSRGVRFRFRAYVPAQEGWPYEPGFSSPVAVTGR